MKLGILLGLLVTWGGPQLAASITLMRPNVLKLEVSSHLQSGAEIYHLNETGMSGGYRYLISENNENDSISPFFLANGRTLTTRNEIDLKNEDTIGLAVLEETSEGKTKVLLPLELHVRLVKCLLIRDHLRFFSATSVSNVRLIEL
jgi:hypothetical protein